MEEFKDNKIIIYNFVKREMNLPEYVSSLLRNKRKHSNKTKIKKRVNKKHRR